MTPLTVLACALCVSVAACGGAHRHVATTASASTTPRPVVSSTPHPGGPHIKDVIADGPPHVKLPQGSLPLSDGDADNPKDTDGNGDVDPGADLDDDSHTRASYKFPDSDDRFPLDLGRGATPAEARELSKLVLRYFAAARAGDAATVCSLLLPETAESLPQDTAHPRPGESCREAAAGLLRRLRHELSASIEVVDVRIVGEAADVVFGSRTMLASHVLLKRSGGMWRLDDPLGHPLL